MDEEYTVGEFMNKDLVIVSPMETAMQCAVVMLAKGISSVIVGSKSVMDGIITEKDISRRVVAKGLDPRTVMAREIMSPDVIFVGPETTLYDAITLLNTKKIKHLPVVKDGVPVGMITATDILRVQPTYIDILQRTIS